MSFQIIDLFYFHNKKKVLFQTFKHEKVLNIIQKYIPLTSPSTT